MDEEKIIHFELFAVYRTVMESVTKNGGGKYPVHDFRNTYENCLGMLGIYSLMEDSSKVLGIFLDEYGKELTTSLGTMELCDDKLILKTMNSIYIFKVLDTYSRGTLN